MMKEAPTNKFLLTLWFWIIFTIVAIISMYLYGVKMIGDKTDLAQTKKALKERNIELLNCNNENDKKVNKIAELNKTILKKNNAISKQANTISKQANTISKQANTISERTITISEKIDIISEKELLIKELNSTITKLKNKPPQIETKYVDRIIYKEKPEPYHPFGKGNGKLTLFKTSNYYNLKFWIDGKYAGRTNTIFKTKPNCGEEGTISKIVLAGKHHINARDEENNSWDFYITIDEDQCFMVRIK